jgi:PAS domain S-box-containing protein
MKKNHTPSSKLYSINNIYKQLEKDSHQCISLIRNSALPILFLSQKGIITYANQSFNQMVGYSNSEIINESIFLFIKTLQDNGSENNLFIDIIKKKRNGDKAFEIQFSKKNGEFGWVTIETLTHKRETVNHERLIQCVLRDITREKELQAQIDRLHKANQEQATMFRNLIENTEGHIVVRKIDNTIAWANNRFLETFGFSSEDIIGKTELNFWPVEVLKKIKVATRVVIRDKKRSTIELFIENKGKQITVLMTIFPMFNEFGEVESTGVLATDISSVKLVQTEIERAYTEAENSRKLLHNFIDNAQISIYVTDIDNRITRANKAFCDWYGLPKEDIFGKTPEELETIVGIKVNDAISEANMQVSDTQLPVNFDCCIFQPILNKTTYFNYTVFPLFSEDGTLLGTGTIMTDKTHAVEHEIELENIKRNVDIYKLKAEYHEYLLQSYIDNIPNYVSICNLEGNVEFINKYASNLWEDTKENLVNKHYTGFIKNDLFLQYVARDFESVVSEQKCVETEEVFSREGKGDIVFLSTMFPIFNKNGVLFAIGIFRKDITDRKHLELERERLLDETQKQQELLRSIMDYAPDFISIKDCEHRYVMVNLAFAKNFQIPKDDFIGKNDLELGFPEELIKGNPEKGITGFWADNSTVIDSGQPMIIPLEPVAVDGVMHTFQTSKIPLKYVDGNVWGVLTFSRDITIEIESVEALRQSKELFKTLYNSTPAMLYSIDKEGEITHVSDYWLEIMGYAREEVIGQNLSCFITAESFQYSIEIVRPLFFKNGACINEKYQFIKKDGEIITCLLSAIAQLDSVGQLVSSLVVLVDITELRRKEEEIATTKRLLQDFLDNIPYPVLIIDLQERITLLNNASAHLHNKTKQQLIGKHHFEYMIDAKLRKGIEKGNDYVLKNQKPIALQEDMTLPNGDPRILSTYKFPLYNSNNEFNNVGIIINDITEQILREKELIEAKKASDDSKQLLNSFMENATPAMFAKDENGDYILINKKKKEYELLHKLERFDPELNSVEPYNSELSRIDDARVIAHNTSMTFYDKLLREDDSVLFVETVKFPIYDKNRDLLGVGGITYDITETVEREKALEEAKQKAEEASSSQERFLASMSHDMRTPLNGVVGMINLMEQTALTTEQKEYIEAMKVSSYNLRVLINDILDISKIQAGKLNIECVLFDLNEILTSLNNVFTHEASRKGVLFSIELPLDTPVMLEGDPSRLNQILNNLIGNALKFTTKGFVKLKLLYENLLDDKVNIEFIIEDSGIGISEENLGKLFQPFVQAGSDTSRKFGGSGLGLSICKSLVVLQQGEISASSKLGEGSIFRFSIPYIKAKQTEIEKTKQVKNMNEFISVQALSPLSCLIAEDNLINQKVAFHALRKVGISVDIADNGKEAVEILRQHSSLYDFVLMDIQMPEMDGYEATKVIRDKLGLNIPIIAMTASALKGERERCIEAGMNDFVPKPFVIEELLYVIRKLINVNQNAKSVLEASNDATSDFIKAETEKANSKFGDEPLFSLESVIEMDDVDFTQEILYVFLDTVPKALQELKKGITTDIDLDTVSRVAHKLKGGVGILQMNEMIRQLSIIEINARNRQNVEQIPLALETCFEIYDAVEGEIVKFKNEIMAKK